MSTSQRLEDCLSPWRTACAPRIASQAASLATKAAEVLSPDVDDKETVQQVALVSKVNGAVAEFAADELLTSCVDWLTGQGLLPPPAVNRIRAEVATGLRLRLPEFHPVLPLPTLVVPYGAWAVVAAGGAILGGVGGASLTWLIGQRELGLIVGSVLGSSVMIGFIAWLSQRPKLLSAMRTVAGTATLLTALGGVAMFFRSQSAGLLKGAGWIAGCWLVLLLARPRQRPPRRDECCEAIRPQIEQLLGHAADLVLSLCWAHPDRVPAAVSLAPPPLAGGLVQALGTLQAVFQDSTASEKVLHSAVRAVLQHVGAEGYEWETVPTGTPFDTALAKRFESFGSIEVGQRVETLEPALVRNGQVVKLGMLRTI